jgi:hypothetical protein
MGLPERGKISANPVGVSILEIENYYIKTLMQ